MADYDSTKDTLDHIDNVRILLNAIFDNLWLRSGKHDASKLEEPEKSMYDKFTPKLKSMTYGSDEYKACLKAMGPALKHHYEHNLHHPEHWENGINDMSLLDVIEMLADWRAASMRHADGDLEKSLKINVERFGISNQLAVIMLNTIRELGWDAKEEK